MEFLFRVKIASYPGPFVRVIRKFTPRQWLRWLFDGRKRQAAGDTSIGHLHAGEANLNRQEFWNVRHHAPDAGGRRALPPPDALLEPEDGTVHLPSAQQDPHHQP